MKALSLLDPKPNECVLDVGCGRGELIKECSNIGCKAIGIDYSVASMEIARNCDPVIRASATRLPFADAAFDKIIFLGVIEHLDRTDSQRALEEIHRVLKKGGSMVLDTESYHPFITALFRFYRRLESLFGMPGYGSLHVDEKFYQVLKSLLIRVDLR